MKSFSRSNFLSSLLLTDRKDWSILVLRDVETDSENYTMHSDVPSCCLILQYTSEGSSGFWMVEGPNQAHFISCHLHCSVTTDEVVNLNLSVQNLLKFTF